MTHTRNYVRAARRKNARISALRPGNRLRATASKVIAVKIIIRPIVAVPIPTLRLGKIESPP